MTLTLNKPYFLLYLKQSNCFNAKGLQVFKQTNKQKFHSYKVKYNLDMIVHIDSLYESFCMQSVFVAS